MEAKVSFAAVGAFVLLLGAALVAGVLWLSSNRSYRNAYDVYVVYMNESVSGLSLDAPVRYRGVAVGAVRRIALAPANIELVEITLGIERGTPVREDTVAVLRTQGLTGIAHVELTGGSQDSAPLRARADEPYPVIRAGPSLMVRLDAALTSLLASLERSSRSLNALLDEDNRSSLRATLANLEVLSRTLAARAAAIDSGVAAASQTMQNAARTSAALPRLVERLQNSAEAVERMANQGAQAGADAGLTMQEARALVAELRELSGSLRSLSGELERNPAMLIRGRPAPRPGPGE